MMQGCCTPTRKIPFLLPLSLMRNIKTIAIAQQKVRLDYTASKLPFSGLASKICCLQFFSFMKDVFTPKTISPDCSFKSNQRLAFFMSHRALQQRHQSKKGKSAKTSYHGVRLGGMMHTTESVSTVCITLWSFLKHLVFLTLWYDSMTLWYDAHLGV